MAEKNFHRPDDIQQIVADRIETARPKPTMDTTANTVSMDEDDRG